MTPFVEYCISVVVGGALVGAGVWFGVRVQKRMGTSPYSGVLFDKKPKKPQKMEYATPLSEEEQGEEGQ